MSPAARRCSSSDAIGTRFRSDRTWAPWGAQHLATPTCPVMVVDPVRAATGIGPDVTGGMT